MLEAGRLRLRPPRPLSPLTPGTGAAPSRPDRPDRPPFPTGFGWLLRRVTALSFGRSQLEYLLGQADMAELIAAIPPIAQHLRPICRMLGVRPLGLFPACRPPRRAAKPPAAAKPEAEAAGTPVGGGNPPAAGPFPAFVPRKRKRRRCPFRLFPPPAAATRPPWPG